MLIYLYISLDTDEEIALIKSNLTVNSIKLQKKRKKQKDKSKVMIIV